MTTNFYGGGSILVNGPTSNCKMFDFAIHNSGTSGVDLRQNTNSGGLSNTHDCYFRGEVNRFCMNPAHDNHADKGTGLHAINMHGGPGGIYNNTCYVYAHDSLRPGESSAGQVWPEGGVGAAIEQGQTPSYNYGNNTLAAYGENLLMNCTGTNPGSTGKQTGGNIFEFWGQSPLTSNTVVWAEGVNISAQITHGTNEAWSNGLVTVQHGRHTNTNLAYPLNNQSSATDAYDRRWGIAHNDCT
jgi:hypothetical protein